MLRKIIPPLIFTLLFISYGAFASSSANVTKIEVLKGEKWWGLFVSNAPVEPFLKPFKINTADSPVIGFFRPVLLSSNGRFIWSGEPMEVEFDGSQIIITSEHEKVNVQKGGKNLRDAYLVSCHKYFPPNGKVPDLSMFSMPQYDTSLELGFSQNQHDIISYAERILAEGLPAGVIIIPHGWSSPVNPYVFNPELYHDAGEMFGRLHSMGFKVMLTVSPYVPAYGKEYVEGLSKGYFLRDGNGEPYVVKTVNGFCTGYDLSEPEQAVIIAEGVRELRSNYPVDGFRFDCRNIMPALADDTRKKEDFMTAWSGLAGEMSLVEFMPAIETSSNSYISGIQTDYDAAHNIYVSIINDMISAGLTGYPYSSVLSVTENPSYLFADNERMAKFLQLEAAMPVMRICFAPWRIKDTPYYNGVVEAIKLRSELGPYIIELASAKTSEPLVRHMEYQFPKMGFYDCDDQFMLGAKYLFAPNTGNSSKRIVRIPKGTWTDRDGVRIKGPVVKEVDNSDGRVIYFRLTGK